MNNINSDNRVPRDHSQDCENDGREHRDHGQAPDATPRGTTSSGRTQRAYELNDGRQRTQPAQDFVGMPWDNAPASPEISQPVAKTSPSTADLSTSSWQNSDNLPAPDRFGQREQQAQHGGAGRSGQGAALSNYGAYGNASNDNNAHGNNAYGNNAYGNNPGNSAYGNNGTMPMRSGSGQRRRSSNDLYKPGIYDSDVGGYDEAPELMPPNEPPRPSQGAPKRRGINPNLLPPSPNYSGGQRERDQYPRNSSGPADAADMRFLWTFFFREARTLVMDPIGFFATRKKEDPVVEPIMIMIIASGISGLLISLSGHVAEGLSLIAGTFVFVALGAFACATALDWLAKKGCYGTVFRIFGFSQAPFVFAWINLGHIPIGWYAACAYSIYLCMVGLEQIYKLDQKWSAMLVITITVALRLVLHLMHL